MAIPRFADRLVETLVPVEQLLLDPNNPRLLTTSFEGVREERIGEPGIQQATLNKLNNGPFDMVRLRGSIGASGLLKIDRIVVRPYGQDTYVVVEGNRRIGATKTLLNQHKEGELTLNEDVLRSLRAPTVLVLNEDDIKNARLDQWVIQGIRHISGIRPWGGYQAARAIQAMVSELGYTEDEVVEALSLTKVRVKRSLRVLSALQQMQEDETYGDLADPELYAYFDEVIKRPKVRNWFRWSEETFRFEDEERLQMLYSWITPDEELNNRRRIPVAESIRSLDGVLDDPESIAVLGVPGNTVDDAVRIARPSLEPEWREPLRKAAKALDGIPTSTLEALQEDDKNLIINLKTLAERRLNQAEQLRLAIEP